MWWRALNPRSSHSPRRWNTSRACVVNTDHQIMISSHDQVCAWDGSRWHFVAEESFYQGQSRVTQRQTLVTYFQGQALYLGPDGLIPIPLAFPDHRRRRAGARPPDVPFP